MYSNKLRKSTRNFPAAEGEHIRTALVTGGTGFVGSHTVEELIARGFRVRCAIRKGRKNLGWLANLNVEAIQADLLDPSSLSGLLDSVEYVFHIAGVTKAKRKREYFAGNALTTKNLLETFVRSRTIRKFCLVSSLTAVGPSYDGKPLDETASRHPITSYGESKREAEDIAMSFVGKLPVVVVRPPAVYGPRDRDILEMFRMAKFRLKPQAGSQEKRISLIHGADLARGLVDATLSERTNGQVYFCSDETIYRYDDLIDEIAGFMGRRAFSVRIPASVIYSIAAVAEFVSFFGPRPAVLSIEKARDLLQPNWVCTSKKIEAHVGFRSRIPIHEGLRKTFEWYRQKGWL